MDSNILDVVGCVVSEEENKIEKTMKNQKESSAPVLSYIELSNKALPFTKEVEGIAFEYMLAGIAKEYSISKEYATIAEFNQKNELSFNKLVTFPFFVAVSNGNSQALYNLFGDFYSLSLGPVSISVYDIISPRAPETDHLRYFAIPSTTNTLGVEVLNPEFYENKFEILQDAIKSKIIEAENRNSQFKEIDIVNDKGAVNKLFQAIDNGIQVIKTQSKNKFWDADKDAILYQAMYFDQFNKNYKNNSYSVLSYEGLVPASRRPFYKESPL